MKNKGLIYILLAGGAILLLSMRKKSGGRVIVPEPEKITAEQFERPSLIQKVSKENEDSNLEASELSF